MYIELFGLPGSGKTRLAQRLKNEFGFLSARNKKHRHALCYVARHPVVMSYWLYSIFNQTFKSGTWKIFRIKLSLLYYTGAFLDKAEKSNGKAVVDEGLVQRMLSVYEEKLDEADVVRALRFIPRADAYIHVTGTEEKYFKRYKELDKGNIRASLGSEYLKKWEVVVRHNHSVIAKVLNKTGENTVVDYAWQDDSLDDTVARIKAYTKNN